MSFSPPSGPKGEVWYGRIIATTNPGFVELEWFKRERGEYWIRWGKLREGYRGVELVRVESVIGTVPMQELDSDKWLLSRKVKAEMAARAILHCQSE